MLLRRRCTGRPRRRNIGANQSGRPLHENVLAGLGTAAASGCNHIRGGHNITIVVVVVVRSTARCHAILDGWLCLLEHLMMARMHTGRQDGHRDGNSLAGGEHVADEHRRGLALDEGGLLGECDAWRMNGLERGRRREREREREVKKQR